MSLVLNGNGTIQNLVAGGLPDGSVTADDIASTLDLSGKTVTLPAGTGGKLLQVVHVDPADGFLFSSTTIKVMDASITTTATNSKILIDVNFAWGFSDSSSDVDAAAAVGYKTGAASSTSTDYTSTIANHGGLTRQGISGLVCFYAQDAYPGANYQQYVVYHMAAKSLISPSQPAGTTLNIALFASAESGTMSVNRPRGATLNDSGYMPGITLMEIAA
jgi:hypothetical protein